MEQNGTHFSSNFFPVYEIRSQFFDGTVEQKATRNSSNLFQSVNLEVSFLMEQWNRMEPTIAEIIFHPENLGSFLLEEWNRTKLI